MNRYMLDTNMVSHLLKSHPMVAQHIVHIPITSLCISAITEGELLFGLAKRPEAQQLHRTVREFLLRVDVLPWDSTVTQRYGMLRAELTRAGRTVAPLGLLIAAHALAKEAVLVSNDRAFGQITTLSVEDWTV